MNGLYRNVLGQIALQSNEYDWELLARDLFDTHFQLKSQLLQAIDDLIKENTVNKVEFFNPDTDRISVEEEIKQEKEKEKQEEEAELEEERK